MGITTIAGAVVNMIFAIKHQVDDQSLWMVAITQILTGLGLIFSRDGAASARDRNQTKDDVADLQFKVAATATAVKTGSTDIIDKAGIPAVTDVKPPIAIILPKG